MSLRIELVDPQGKDAVALLREAAIAARALYPETRPADGPWPTNAPNSQWVAYIVGYFEGDAAACGALRILSEYAVEVKRMFVRENHRRGGCGRQILLRLLELAAERGYRAARLETGTRQPAAMALYKSEGFRRIPCFGEHATDPYALCFELELRSVGPSKHA